MMKKLLLISLLCFSSLGALHMEPVKPELVVHNKVLVRVNGNPISVMDLVKKMDMIFYREYAKYADQPEARLQFYQASWRPILQELINKELVLADVKSKEMPVSHGDIREEMEQMFGPNIMASLDDLGMSYEEAWGMVREDITIKRMMWFRVNMRAMGAITPVEIQKMYEQHVAQTEAAKEWVYQVLSFQSEDPGIAEGMAQLAYQKIIEDRVTLEDLKGFFDNEKDVRISLTKPFNRTRESISAPHWEGISELREEQFSTPIAQKSRSKGQSLYRIYYLKGHECKTCEPFAAIHQELENQLMGEGMNRETEAYFSRLQNDFEIEELVNVKSDALILFTLS